MKTPTTATQWQHRIDEVIARLAGARSQHEAIAAASDLGFALSGVPKPPARQRIDVCARCGTEEITFEVRWSEGQPFEGFYCRDCGAFEEAA